MVEPQRGLTSGRLESGLVCASVTAAAVGPIKGEASVSRGSGFEQIVRASIGAGPRDRVMPGARGSAKLLCWDSGAVDIRAGSAALVRKKSPCTAPALIFDGQTNRRDQGLAPIAIGADGPFLAFCVNTLCEDSDDGQAFSLASP